MRDRRLLVICPNSRVLRLVFISNYRLPQILNAVSTINHIPFLVRTVKVFPVIAPLSHRHIPNDLLIEWVEEDIIGPEVSRILLLFNSLVVLKLEESLWGS